ncbi:reverse transcriptase domain-containing protein [Tanacetum coccineum]
MLEDSRVPLILGRPFLAIAQAMIDIFNKNITLRVGDDEVIFDVDQSIKRPPNEEDEWLEKSTNQSDLESCESLGNKSDDDSDLEKPIRPSANEIDEKKPELKILPHHLECAYLHGDKSFPIIISFELSEKEKMLLFQVLEKFIGWRVCINYRKLNDATRKDHFPLLFIDQMLKRLCGNEYYHFLDRFLGFFQIPISPEDQEKTTFTCPYGTFAYKRMSFGLCNAPATFQRSMTVIFHDMMEDFMKVFLDDFSVFDNSFNCCLANLDRMLARCEETNLVLNWEKCHFMVKEGIVLGHKISGAFIEVDRAKIDVIAKFPYPTNIKGVRNFLGHVGFYLRMPNPRLIDGYVLQGFDIEIKDKKGQKT